MIKLYEDEDPVVSKRTLLGTTISVMVICFLWNQINQCYVCRLPLVAHLWQWGSILSLRDCTWIGDEIINSYCSMIVEDSHLKRSKILMFVFFKPCVTIQKGLSFPLFPIGCRNVLWILLTQSPVTPAYHLQWGYVISLFWVEIQWWRKMDQSSVTITQRRVIQWLWRCIFSNQREQSSLGAPSCVT